MDCESAPYIDSLPAMRFYGANMIYIGRLMHLLGFDGYDGVLSTGQLPATAREIRPFLAMSKAELRKALFDKKPSSLVDSVFVLLNDMRMFDGLVLEAGTYREIWCDGSRDFAYQQRIADGLVDLTRGIGYSFAEIVILTTSLASSPRDNQVIARVLQPEYMRTNSYVHQEVTNVSRTPVNTNARSMVVALLAATYGQAIVHQSQDAMDEVIRLTLPDGIMVRVIQAPTGMLDASRDASSAIDPVLSTLLEYALYRVPPSSGSNIAWLGDIISGRRTAIEAWHVMTQQVPKARIHPVYPDVLARHRRNHVAKALSELFRLLTIADYEYRQQLLD